MIFGLCELLENFENFKHQFFRKLTSLLKNNIYLALPKFLKPSQTAKDVYTLRDAEKLDTLDSLRLSCSLLPL